MKDDPEGDSVAEQKNEPTPTDEDTPPSSTPTPLDVCALVGAERVQELFERSKTPDIQRPDPDQLGGPVPGIGAISYCTYRWEKGQTPDQVRVTVMSEIEETDPEAFVDAGADEETKPLAGAGDAAVIERSERFGHGLASAKSALNADAGLVAVTILAPLDSKDEAFVGLANEFFEHAADF